MQLGLAPPAYSDAYNSRIEFLSSPPPRVEFTSGEPDQEFDLIQPGCTFPSFWVAMAPRIHEVVYLTACKSTDSHLVVLMCPRHKRLIGVMLVH